MAGRPGAGLAADAFSRDRVVQGLTAASP